MSATLKSLQTAAKCLPKYCLNCVGVVLSDFSFGRHSFQDTNCFLFSSRNILLTFLLLNTITFNVNRELFHAPVQKCSSRKGLHRWEQLIKTTRTELQAPHHGVLSTCSYINITSCFLVVFLFFLLCLCKQISLLKTTPGIQPFFNNLPFIWASHMIFSLVFSFFLYFRNWEVLFSCS